MTEQYLELQHSIVDELDIQLSRLPGPIIKTMGQPGVAVGRSIVLGRASNHIRYIEVPEPDYPLNMFCFFHEIKHILQQDESAITGKKKTHSRSNDSDKYSFDQAIFDELECDAYASEMMDKYNIPMCGCIKLFTALRLTIEVERAEKGIY